MGDNFGFANSYSGSWKVMLNGELIVIVFCLFREMSIFDIY